MSFWTEKTVEPKRTFRWLLYFTGMPQFIAKSVKKPSFQVSTTPHQFLNYEFHYPGAVKWQPISMTIVDPVNPDSTKSLYKILENSGYVIPSNYREQFAATISKEAMVNALGGQIAIAQLDAEGNSNTPLEKWIIKNPLITSVDFGELNYSSEEMLNITINITYDYATIEGLPQNDANGTFNTTTGGLWTLNPNRNVRAVGDFTGDDLAPTNRDD